MVEASMIEMSAIIQTSRLMNVDWSCRVCIKYIKATIIEGLLIMLLGLMMTLCLSICIVSCQILRRVQFCHSEEILDSYLWDKYSGERGLPMVPWDIRTMAKDKDYLGLIDVETQGNILATKKVV